MNRISVAPTRVWSHVYSVQQGCDVAFVSDIHGYHLPSDDPTKAIVSSNVSTRLKTMTHFRNAWILVIQEIVDLDCTSSFVDRSRSRWQEDLPYCGDYSVFRG